ncbi:MAG: hypothetical protein A2025_00500 [Chloroflexi bacterium RBG_19FT_COMBO_47_15]|nr:MAG: hypothetical protein A2025_00500 [Chloroflexi bacterium RBG_19FT_COMBO_47_15]
MPRKAFGGTKHFSQAYQNTGADIIVKVKRRDEIYEILWQQDLIQFGKVLKGGETSEKESII